MKTEIIVVVVVYVVDEGEGSSASQAGGAPAGRRSDGGRRGHCSQWRRHQRCKRGRSFACPRPPSSPVPTSFLLLFLLSPPLHLTSIPSNEEGRQ
eukprot:671741-Pyramimonas_sp.AAC.2